MLGHIYPRPIPFCEGMRPRIPGPRGHVHAKGGFHRGPGAKKTSLCQELLKERGCCKVASADDAGIMM